MGTARLKVHRRSEMLGFEGDGGARASCGEVGSTTCELFRVSNLTTQAAAWGLIRIFAATAGQVFLHVSRRVILDLTCFVRSLASLA